MANVSRRSAISQLAGALVLPALPMARLANSRTNVEVQTAATVTFVIDFSGPLAFVEVDKWIHVFAPETKATHYPVVSSDSGELLLPDGDGYKFTAPDPKTMTTPFGARPLPFKVHDAISKAYDNCRIGIQIPRPDYVKGITTAKVKVGNSNPAPLPTGLRFIYRGISNATVPVIQSAGASFAPNFDPLDPVWQIKIRMVPEDVDRCHADAIQSFKEMAALCGISPVPAISYHDPSPCPADHRQGEDPMRLLRGPGSDCQVIPVWVTNT